MGQNAGCVADGRVIDAAGQGTDRMTGERVPEAASGCATGLTGAPSVVVAGCASGSTAGRDASAVNGVAGDAATGEFPGEIVVVDYHKGNLSSVARGLARAGATRVAVSDEPERIRSAAGIVLPGVGSFYDAITYMAESGQARAVLDAVGAGVPFLGICLGLQLLFDRGDEDVPGDVPVTPCADAMGSALEPGAVFEAEGRRWARGLGVLRGSCTRLSSSRLKVPHVGWDQVHLTAAGRSCPLLEGFPEGASMYFTHSYAVSGDADDACVAARTFYASSFPCVAWVGNVYGCQFHPEKSSGRGLDILRNFVRVVESQPDPAGFARSDSANATRPEVVA